MAGPRIVARRPPFETVWCPPRPLPLQDATLVAVWLTLIALPIGTALTPGALGGPSTPMALSALMLLSAAQVGGGGGREDASPPSSPSTFAA